MNAATRRTNRRQLRATLRQRTRDNRATHHATKAVATGRPQSAKNHLIAAGLDAHTAKRFAGAFSRGAQATGTDRTTVKLRGRRRKAVTVKLYDRDAFTARLITYRPKDKTAAAKFARLAHALAA